MNPAVGRHFFIGIPGPTLDASTITLLKTIQPGGIILFGRNVKNPNQLATLTEKLRTILGSQLLICLDHEGGRVNRLKELVGVVPSAQQLGYCQNTSWSAKHGELTGRLLHSFGVNVNLAPVLDLHLKPRTDNSVPDRCWSRNPKIVAEQAGAFLNAMQREGVIGCGKHFIGYGAADKDPHLVLPRVDRTRSQILKQDLKPYEWLLPSKKKALHHKERHLNLIMLSHAHLKAFHGNHLTPACISPKIVKDLLRTKLRFKGVSITDDLEMGAITRTMSIGQASVACLKAGSDFILICHTAKAMKEGFEHAVEAGHSGEWLAQDREASQKRLAKLHALPPPCPKFSMKRFKSLVHEIQEFRKQVFSELPEKLKVIDERWGAIGEKY